ncbi:MAG TPA: GNAT family N-acetyltransferase [Jatrophihabitans sp.]|jgi:GNAT superfamily N-acetyltransferase
MTAAAIRTMQPVQSSYTGDRTELVRLPWALRVDGVSMVVRPSTARDLANVAVMHHHCSARTLLGRYQLGGRSPSILALDRLLRQPLSFVVTMRESTGIGAVVAMATLSTDLRSGSESLHAGVIVEDSWQHLGIGNELMAHVAGVASVSGCREIVAYPGLMTEATQRMVTSVGTTRMVNNENGIQLRTSLPTSAASGLGPLRAGVLADGDEMFLRRIG